MADYSFSPGGRQHPSSYIPRRIMPPVSLKLTPLKSNSSQNSEDKIPNKLRRLSSLSLLAKPFGHHKGTSSESSTKGSKQARFAVEHACEPQNKTSRRSSPHPKKAILARSSTTSYLPLPNPGSRTKQSPERLPSSKTTSNLTSSRLKPRLEEDAGSFGRPILSPHSLTVEPMFSRNIALNAKATNVGTQKQQRYSAADMMASSDPNKENWPLLMPCADSNTQRISSHHSHSSVRSSIEESRERLRKSIDEMFPLMAESQVESGDDTISACSATNTNISVSRCSRTETSCKDASASFAVSNTACNTNLRVPKLSFHSCLPSDPAHPLVRDSHGKSIPQSYGPEITETKHSEGRSKYSIRQSSMIPAAVSQPALLRNVSSVAPVQVEASTEYLVFKAQPSSFWTGRFVSMNDRLLNEAQEMRVNGNKIILIGPEREEIRTRMIFRALENQCKTKAARKSLAHFKAEFAIIKGMPELLITPLSGGFHVAENNRSRELDSSSSRYSNVSPVNSELLDLQTQILSKSFGNPGRTSLETAICGPASEMMASNARKERKSSFIDRLMGKGRR